MMNTGYRLTSNGKVPIIEPNDKTMPYITEAIYEDSSVITQEQTESSSIVVNLGTLNAARKEHNLLTSHIKKPLYVYPATLAEFSDRDFENLEKELSKINISAGDIRQLSEIEKAYREKHGMPIMQNL